MTIGLTYGKGLGMARIKEKVTLSIDPRLLGWVDELVGQGAYESRSAALEAGFEALHHKRCDEQFEAALAALTPEDVAEGIAMAEEGVQEWAAQLDAEDGGWGSQEVQHVAAR